MSDINTYADEAAITALTPINGDLVLNTGDNSLYLCTDSAASGIARWKKFTNDSAFTPPPFDGWSAGFSSSSYQFLDLSAARSALDSATAFSLSAWIKYTSFTSRGVIWSSGTAGSRLSGCWYTNGNLVFTVRGGQGVHSNYATVSAPPLNTWAHIACVFDNGQGTAYVTPTDTGITASNTVDFIYQETPVNVTDTNGGAGLRVGTFSHALIQGFEGNINDVAVWDSALSASDVATIYGSGKPTAVSAPYGWWRMGDDSNDSPVDTSAVASITDSSGNGYHGVQATADRQPTFSTDVPA